MRVVAVVAALALVVGGCSKDPEAQDPGRTPSSSASSSAVSTPPPTGTPSAPKPSAQVVSERKVGSRLVELTIRSAAVGQTVQVRLLTPDGWERRAGKTWPVLYLLHGCCDRFDRWSTETDIATLPQLRDVLVVMPEGGPVGYYSDWWNNGRGGTPAWETFHVRELLPLVESRYGGGKNHAIAGLSMGGLGALLYAARNPGVFLAAASFSGVVHPLTDGFSLALAYSAAQYNENSLNLWGDPEAQRSIWEQHDPYYLTAKLKGIPLFLSCGNGTPGPLDKTTSTDPNEQFLGGMNRTTAAQFKKAGLTVTTDFYGPGTHTWPYWERELHKALPLLLAPLK